MNTQLASVKRNTGFDLQPTNVSEAMKLATMIANSQLAPKSFAGKPDDTLVAMMMGNELGLNPMQAIQNIAVINGRPSIWGDALLALVQNHPAYVSIEETFDDATMTASCTVVRRGGNPHTQRYSQEDAIKAGLWNKQGPWQQHPKRMLQMRARGFALRNQFADALLGLITAEEARDYPIDTHTGEPSVSTTQSIEHKPSELPTYSDEQFQANFPTWQELVNNGKTLPNRIIEKLSTEYTVSAKHQDMIINMHVPSPPDTPSSTNQGDSGDDWLEEQSNGGNQ